MNSAVIMAFFVFQFWSCFFVVVFCFFLNFILFFQFARVDEAPRSRHGCQRIWSSVGTKRNRLPAESVRDALIFVSFATEIEFEM